MKKTNQTSIKKDLPDSLSSELPWETWVNEASAFATQQAELFRVFEISPTGSAFMSKDESIRISENIGKILMRIMPGLSCQLIAKVDQDVESILGHYESYRGRATKSKKEGRNICRKIIRMQADHVRDSVKSGFPLRPSNKMHRIKMYFTILVPNPKRNKKLPEAMRKILSPVVPKKNANFFSTSDIYAELIKEELQSMTDMLDQTEAIIASGFSETGISISRLDGGEAVNVLYQFRNPSRSSIPSLSTTVSNDDDWIRHQVSHDPLEETSFGIKMGAKGREKFGIVTTMKVQPNQVFASDFKKILANVIEGHITFNFTIQQMSKVSAKLQGKRFLAQVAGVGKSNIYAQNIVNSIDDLTRLTASGDAAYVYYSVTDVRWFNTADINNESVKIETQWTGAGSTSYTESIYAKALWMRSLPGCYSEFTSNFDARSYLTTTRHLARLIPTIWDWAGVWKRGNPCAESLGISRANELVPTDKWTNEAAHGCLVGTTGTGKSFKVNMLIVEDLSCDDTDVFVIDVGNSYGATAEALGDDFAQLLILNVDDPVCFNMFYGEGTKVKIAAATAIIATMLIDDAAIDKIDANKKTLIMRAVQASFELELDREPTMSDCMDILKDLEGGGVNGRHICDVLSPFFGNGPYAGFFDGQMQFKPESNYVVFEMGGVKELKRLMGPLFLVMTNFLRNRVENSGSLISETGLSRRTVIYIDEAHNSMTNELAAQMINSFYAEARKFGGAIWTITQNLFNYLKFPGGDNMLAMSSSMMVLSQDMEQTVAKAEPLGLSEIKLSAIGDIKKQEDFAFSEYLHVNASGTANEKGSHLRYYAHPHPLMLFNTDKDLRDLRDELKKEHPDASMLDIAARMHEIKRR